MPAQIIVTESSTADQMMRGTVSSVGELVDGHELGG